MTFHNIQQQVAAEVRAAVARAAVSHREVALAVGITPATFSRKASGATPFSVVDITLIAVFLRIDPGSFFTVPKQVAA